MIRVSSLRAGNVVEQGGIELIEGWTEGEECCIWVDIVGGTQEDVEPLLEEWFGFHELAAEDSLSDNTLPKYDRFPRYDFFVFRSLNVDVAAHGVEPLKIACFLGSNFLFTIHGSPIVGVDRIWNRLPQDHRLIRSGADFLLYSVLDLLVDDHFPTIDAIEERIDEIQELIFTEPAATLLDELLHLKRDLNVMRRYTLPQRDLLNQISRGDCQFIRAEHLIYYRDVYDHMYRIGESIDVERDLATGTMEAYLSVIANRTNDIMKVLTIFSSILLPINLVAGIYGMNFEHMPELHWHFGYMWAFTLMLTICATMLIWFYRRGWLWQSSRRKAAHERHIARMLNRRAHRGPMRGPEAEAQEPVEPLRPGA
jgi:magnesium transporter